MLCLSIFIGNRVKKDLMIILYMYSNYEGVHSNLGMTVVRLS